jgi:hypothetical protein
MEEVMNKLFIVFLTLTLFSCTKTTNKSPEQDVCKAEFALKYNTALNHVLFAIVHNEPIEYFKERITADKEQLKKIKPNQKIEGADILVKHNMIINYWNSVLDTVRGRDILSLDNSSIKYLEKSKHNRTTNCFKNAWLFTRMFGWDKEGLGWSIPLELDKDKTLKVVLTKNNTVDFKKLEEIYDSIVK